MLPVTFRCIWPSSL